MNENTSTTKKLTKAKTEAPTPKATKTKATQPPQVADQNTKKELKPTAASSTATGVKKKEAATPKQSKVAPKKSLTSKASTSSSKEVNIFESAALDQLVLPQGAMNYLNVNNGEPTLSISAIEENGVPQVMKLASLDPNLGGISLNNSMLPINSTKTGKSEYLAATAPHKASLNNLKSAGTNDTYDDEDFSDALKVQNAKPVKKVIRSINQKEEEKISSVDKNHSNKHSNNNAFNNGQKDYYQPTTNNMIDMISEDEDEDLSLSGDEVEGAFHEHEQDEFKEDIDGNADDAAKKKKKKGFSQLKEMVPLNLEAERLIFFASSGCYNPFFVYSQPDIRIQFAKPHKAYLPLAIKILNACIKEYGTDAIFSEEAGGRIISMDETTKYFTDYIHDLALEEHLTFCFAENTVAPTCVYHESDTKSRVVIGLPVQYHEKRIMGVLNHEVGTHFVRKFNDKLQPWFKNRKKLQMKAYICHEEGLAALNQLLEPAMDETQKPFLFNAAFHYYSAYMASELGFADLFEDLKKFMPDEDKRWKECVRVKRGIQDTSEPTGMYKDQVYLRGAVDILKDRRKIDFVAFHGGKMSVPDYLRVSKMGALVTEGLKTPFFLNDLVKYHAALDRIAAINGIDQFLEKKLTKKKEKTVKPATKAAKVDEKNT